MTMGYTIVYAVAVAVLSGCKGTNGAHNVYQISQDYFRNPDRGFYVHTETKSSNYQPLTVQDLEDIQDGQTALVLRLYILDSFVTSDISTQFLTDLGTDLSRVKDAGLSCILRFCYANTNAAPRDASKQWVLQHVQSLAPTLNQYSDVISALQAGFIGVWGEWYLSDNFGTPWTNTGYLGLTNQHWADRSEVVQALVDDITQEIPILIRTPYYKMKVLDTTVAATFSDVTSGNDKGRLGHHNDCFLRTPSDMGTYYIETAERPYLEQETLVLPNGGETCGLSTVDASNTTLTDRSKCPTALQELGDYHFSFLNRNYHPDVLQSWVSDECWEEVKTRLGYSLRLTESDLPDTVSAGGILAYSITITNAGWAAPYRPYKVLLVLKSASGVYYSAELNDDPRTWSAGDDHVIQGSVKVNPSTAPGEYKMYLGIVQASLSDRPDYFILMENINVPQPASGLNSLLHTVTVSGSDQTTSSSPTLESWTPPSQNGSRACSKASISDHSFETGTDWADYGDDGWTSVSEEAQDGSMSAKVTDGGAVKEILFSKPIHKLTLSAYSKNVDGPATIAQASDYSLYCDLQKENGDYMWGRYTPFTIQDSSWHKVTLIIDETDAFVKARCHLLYRNIDQGAAYFDNIFGSVASDDVTDVSQCS